MPERSRSSDGMVSVLTRDRITIHAQGVTVSGTVLSAIFWGPPDGWYIEITLDNGRYSYWKQGLDGGEIVAVESRP